MRPLVGSFSKNTAPKKVNLCQGFEASQIWHNALGAAWAIQMGSIIPEPVAELCLYLDFLL